MTTIQNNHNSNPHPEVTIAAADLDATTDQTYEIGEGGGNNNRHTHTLILGSADMAKLRAGEAVTVESSDGGGHTHPVLVFCA